MLGSLQTQRSRVTPSRHITARARMAVLASERKNRGPSSCVRRYSINSLNTLSTKRSSLPQSFTFEGYKHYFPPLFFLNTTANQNYVGPQPEYYKWTTRCSRRKSSSCRGTQLIRKFPTCTKSGVEDVSGVTRCYCQQEVRKGSRSWGNITGMTYRTL